MTTAKQDGQNGITAQGCNIPRHFFRPRRTDRVGDITGAAKKKKNGLIKSCGVALKYLFGNVAERKDEGRNDENRCQRPDFRSIQPHVKM